MPENNMFREVFRPRDLFFCNRGAFLALYMSCRGLKISTSTKFSSVLLKSSQSEQYREIWDRFSANGPLRARICRIGARSADICSIVLNGVPHPFSRFSLKISKRFTQNLLKDQQSRLVYKNYLENNFSSVWFPLKQHTLLVVRQLGQLGVPVN